MKTVRLTYFHEQFQMEEKGTRRVVASKPVPIGRNRDFKPIRQVKGKDLKTTLKPTEISADQLMQKYMALYKWLSCYVVKVASTFKTLYRY